MEQKRAEIMEIFREHQFFEEEEMQEWENEVLPSLDEEGLKEVEGILVKYLQKHEAINAKYELEKEEILKEELIRLKSIIREETHKAVLIMREREEKLRQKEEAEMADLDAQLQNI